MKSSHGHHEHHHQPQLRSFTLPIISALRSSSNDKHSPSTAPNNNDSTPLDIQSKSSLKQHQQQEPQLQYTTYNIASDNFPIYITKDDPKPAIFIARKLISDFVELANVKIDAILGQENRSKPIFELIDRKHDLIYDQILEGVGAISEFCLPSLLRILSAWYRHQLGVDENLQKRPQSSIDNQQQQLSQSEQAQPPDCNSPCNDNSISYTNLTTIRSPTPSSPDLSNRISITSTLPLDYQSPSLTITSDPLNSSAANTSNSTATNVSSNSLLEHSATTFKRSELIKTRKLLIEYAFCQVLVEIFSQLHLHPGHEDLIGEIEDIAFDHFKHKEPHDFHGLDPGDVNGLANKFAEVIGVLAQTRFRSVRKRFMSELNELRAKELTSHNIQCIVTLLSSMRHFRVKMAPIEEFEASFQFLQECADFFLETRHKSIKHALADLFVEIMVPLASTVKNEVKIPCLKNFVDTLWTQTLDMCARKKHSTTLFPLVTCLLCVSQRSLFLANWGSFLNMCLSNLKNRDPRMCRVALESLYRLIWIYMIRVKCESNNITQAKLNSIVDALFPRASRTVTPRDTPLSIFVDIIQFIAQERLDFAMRHIIFDLLSAERSIKVIVSPERMNIGLQAFLVVADSLQHKDGDPPMPIAIGAAVNVQPATTTCGLGKQLRRSQLSGGRMLNDDIAKSIGLAQYYPIIKKSFGDILRALDTQFGRPLLLNSAQNTNREPEDVITSERKPKVDLFKTCIAAIPRLVPDGMSKADLIDLLSRMTIHVDEEMRKNAFESLQTLITEHTDWRLEAIEGYTLFVANQIDESMRHLIDNALRILLQFLINWRTAIAASSSSASKELNSGVSISIQTGYETISSRTGGTGGQIAARKNRALTEMRLMQSELSNMRFDKLVNVIQKVEAASLVMLCNYNQPTRRLASQLLRECRSILICYSSWTRMDQFGLRSLEEAEEEDLSASIKGSLSADNLSRITATSANGPAHSSVTSMNTQAVLSTSVSRMCIQSTSQQQQPHQQQSSLQHQHDPYDSDIENNLADCLSGDDNALVLFWLSVIMLECCDKEQQEFAFGLRLLKRILPSLPLEQPEFLAQLDRNLKQMEWDDFPGIHSLVLKGCTSGATYAISVALLDHLTPSLKHPICGGQSSAEELLPVHVLVLLTHLLSNYDDPSAFSMNIARRLALCCEENSQRLENLAAVLTLYSRRSFSKDAFQWIKCVVKYLYDASPAALPSAVALLVELLEAGPAQVQRLVAPVLYCVLTYVDVAGQQVGAETNQSLVRIYNHYLGGASWRDAVQIFKLIISRSSSLADSTTRGRELAGRVMDFDMDVECMTIIAKSRLVETSLPSPELDTIGDAPDSNLGDALPAGGCRAGGARSAASAGQQWESREQPKQQQQQDDMLLTSEGRRSLLASGQIRERLARLLTSV